ncbi:hypothetical protein K443DRAFT_682642 [Laccaria amethystina LaAM-08-1]|uniref:Uncharacterized protein n=1 Tax=Laccaria amethystina LaAM-08-1 TaxID=1095629 RepID=A0A0C9XEB9_9AGAR|nr:hypothetical protein K443DRAFT_682642 [Laccaria amethystina LaAM-08-1]
MSTGRPSSSPSLLKAPRRVAYTLNGKTRKAARSSTVLLSDRMTFKLSQRKEALIIASVEQLDSHC